MSLATLPRIYQKGQTTVEYTLLACCVALPLSLVMFKVTQVYLARLLVRIVANFSGYGGS